MPDAALIRLSSDLARLLHRRSSTPRAEALALAYRRITDYAIDNNMSERWRDSVMLLFIGESRVSVAA